MKKTFSLLVFLPMLLLCLITPVNAADWVTMETTDKHIYQVDRPAISFTGDSMNTTLEIWLKVVSKDQPDYYELSHLYIMENFNLPVMFYKEKEHGKYLAADGSTVSLADNSAKHQELLLPNSPQWLIAKRLFAEYRANYKPSPIAITVDPQELQKALDGKIKHGGGNGDPKWFYVRDTTKSLGVHFTFDFWLVIEANNSRTNRLNFSTIVSMPGRHTMREAITVRVDEWEWTLTAPQPRGATSFPFGVNFKYSFAMPDTLVQAIMATKNSIAVKWYYDSQERVYIIPAAIVRNMAIMYAGCK